MSEFHVQVVRIGAVEKHPNADTLSMTAIHGGYPVIFQTGSYKEGDLAVYVPIDAIVPEREEWAFLKSRRRIRALKLRGIFSMGVLTPAPAGAAEGDDVAEALGITKYEEPTPEEASEDTIRPKGAHIPVYDVEGLRRWMDVLVPGEEVIITEKLNGENGRYLLAEDGLHIGSRTRWKKDSGKNPWSRVARAAQIEERLRGAFLDRADLVFYGEVHGHTGGFAYGRAGGPPLFRVFDVFDRVLQEWLDYKSMMAVCHAAGLDTVPLLYQGPWSFDLLSDVQGTSLAEGPSTLDASHVREGVVIRPVKEREHRPEGLGENGLPLPALGRVNLKYVGQGYLLRK